MSETIGGYLPPGTWSDRIGRRNPFIVIGPLISDLLINRYGVYMVIDGVGGMVPTEALFTGSAAMTLLCLLPLVSAARCEQQRRAAA